jgi:hypothetical protein
VQKLCALSGAVGSLEECPQAWCAFWETGGAVAEAGCLVERLGIDLSGRDLARYLIDLRRMLETARDEAQAEVARRQLNALVPPDLSGA